MTSEREALVRQSCRLLTAHGADAARLFYDRLFLLDPGVRALFVHVDMDAQRTKFVAMLSSIIDSLSEPPHFVADVASLGRRHATYGASAQHYETVGAALLWTVEQVLGDACTAECRAAWVEAYALVAAVMRRAAQQHSVASAAHLTHPA